MASKLYSSATQIMSMPADSSSLARWAAFFGSPVYATEVDSFMPELLHLPWPRARPGPHVAADASGRRPRRAPRLAVGHSGRDPLTRRRPRLPSLRCAEHARLPAGRRVRRLVGRDRIADAARTRGHVVGR